MTVPPFPRVPEVARAISDARYFTATIEVIRTKGLETDADGDKVSSGVRVVAEMPGRIVRGSDPRETLQAERVTTTATWEVRLSLSAIEALKRERGCFEIKGSDILRDKDSGEQYSVIADDGGRTEATFLSVTTVKVG